jgi:hypothetical protein
MATTVRIYSKETVEARLTSFFKFSNSIPEEAQRRLFGTYWEGRATAAHNSRLDDWQCEVARNTTRQLLTLFGFAQPPSGNPGHRVWVRAVNEVLDDLTGIMNEYDRHRKEMAARGLMATEDVWAAETSFWERSKRKI